ncbi:MAG: DUF6512 family protein [Lachnospiraceae bacterium]|nr:DUF6512 family protein [Lachnospiraceae bacterium]MDD7049741.1 DUF6512 family protein [Lachnospiraceae bacterium]MDY4096091.1 DUF6512 family protein [Lachnospiraceae bacterium]
MNKLNQYIITGIIFVIITGTVSHFVYEWSGKNFILGFFFPVNESTWEHMKLCFFPMLIYSLYMEKKLKNECPCIAAASYFGTLLGTFLIPVIFYTYSGIMGKSFLPLDISTFILSVLLAFWAVYRLTLSRRINSYSFLLTLLIFIMAICFLLFTYLPPDINLFIAPTKPDIRTELWYNS